MNQPTTLPAPQPARAFVASRFLALLRVDWAERKRSYYALAAVVLVVHVLFLGLIAAGAPAIRPLEKDTLMTLYYSLLLVFLAAFFCVLFAPLQRQGSALLALVRPASSLEKWLHAVLMLLVAMPLAYTLIFELLYLGVNAIAAHAEATHYAKLAAEGQKSFNKPVGFQWFVPLLGNDSQGMAMAQAMYLWLTVVLAGFGAYSLVKFQRAAALKALGLAVVLLLCTLLLLLVSSSEPSVLFEWGKPAVLRRNGWDAWLAQCLFWLVCPLLLWLASFWAWLEKDLA